LMKLRRACLMEIGVSTCLGDLLFGGTARVLGEMEFALVERVGVLGMTVRVAMASSV
jgi:hypothetical protein